MHDTVPCRAIEAQAAAQRRRESAEAERVLADRHARIARDTERAKAAIITGRTPGSVCAASYISI